jgi:DNA primase
MNLLDLVGRYATLKKVASTHGGEYAGTCPWCGGIDRFRAWPSADKPGYWCRQCDRKGDAIQFLRDYEGLSYREACQQLGHPVVEGPRPSVKPQPKAPRPTTAPHTSWQATARAFTEACTRALWAQAGLKALAYLRARGFSDETLQEARVGYHAADERHPAETWGLPTDHKAVWLPRGVTLPWFQVGELWRLIIRQVGPNVPHAQKYVAVSGGSNTLYRVDTLHANRPAMIVEGVLDALAIVQEAGDLLTVVAAGSTTGGRLERWIGRLGLTSTVLVSFDADPAGEEAAGWWLRALGRKAKRWRPYWDDPNAMLQDGADVRNWIREGLNLHPAWWRELAAWPGDRREHWAERASIMEFEGGLIREEAERIAAMLTREDETATRLSARRSPYSPTAGGASPAARVQPRRP